MMSLDQKLHPYFYHHFPDNNQESTVKESENDVWKTYFFQSFVNLKTSFICQSNVILAFI